MLGNGICLKPPVRADDTYSEDLKSFSVLCKELRKMENEMIQPIFILPFRWILNSSSHFVYLFISVATHLEVSDVISLFQIQKNNFISGGQ